MVADNRSVSIACRVDDTPVSATEAVSLGLIVTELVINALKHAFVDNLTAGRIAVTYDLWDGTWCLAVSDNGIGRRAQATTPGLGTGIIGALVRQLDNDRDIVVKNECHQLVQDVVDTEAQQIGIATRSEDLTGA